VLGVTSAVPGVVSAAALAAVTPAVHMTLKATGTARCCYLEYCRQHPMAESTQLQVQQETIMTRPDLEVFVKMAAETLIGWPKTGIEATAFDSRHQERC